MGKHPKTGEPREVHQPLSIDALPVDVHQSIKELRATFGMTWAQIEQISSLPYGHWRQHLGKFGFIDWDALPAHQLAKFSQRRLPKATLIRWYDIRVEQARKDTEARSVSARKIAEVFAAAHIENAPEAVINAARDVIFELLTQTDTKSRVKASAGLIALADVMNGAEANAIKKRKVAVEERRMAQMEKDAAVKRKRLEQETESAAKKLKKGGELGIADINRLRERTFGLPPIAAS